MASAVTYFVKVDEVFNAAWRICLVTLDGILRIDRAGVGNDPYSCGGF